jgi:hypothetical protein
MADVLLTALFLLVRLDIFFFSKRIENVSNNEGGV